jgi:seryl-tRNA synthetase
LLSGQAPAGVGSAAGADFTRAHKVPGSAIYAPGPAKVQLKVQLRRLLADVAGRGFGYKPLIN